MGGEEVEISVVRIAATNGALLAVVNNAVQTISALSIDRITNVGQHLLRLAQRGVTLIPVTIIMSTPYSENCAASAPSGDRTHKQSESSCHL